MEVTRKNFKQSLPLVEESIKAADFLVIDTEFTGLMNGRDVLAFDSPEEYYLRLLNGCSDFLLIQYGLCAFRWDEKANHYLNESYNFYLFPRGRPGPEKMFLCQSSSLDFLAAQGFDFNKLIREGISYMTEPAETKLRQHITERQKTYSNKKDHIPVPEENKQQIIEICTQVRNFLDEKKSNELEIDKCNAFVRLLLFQELGNKFSKEAFIETKVLENKNRVLKVIRITSENDGKTRNEQRKEKDWEELEEAVGFSKVARMISQSGKLVVGHNMVLDMLHTLNHFFQPLPADYPAFKEFAHCMFPKILDTKYMSSLPPFKDKVNSSVLSHLLATLSESPFALPKVESAEGRGYTLTDDKHHEAGYDAFTTGLCFLSMLGHILRMRGEQSARFADSNALKPFENKLYLAKTAHQDSPFINLAGSEPSPTRDHVFHLTFPKEWRKNDIVQLFSPFGSITVQFLDDSSALVALMRRQEARSVMRALNDTKLTQIIPYAQYKHVRNKVQIQDDKHWRKADQETTCMNAADSTPRSREINTDNTRSTVSDNYIPEKVERPAATPAKAKTIVSPAQRIGSPAQSIGSPTQSIGSPAQSINIPVQSNNSPAQSILSPVKTGRKRTSSGVFQIDDEEPATKRAERTRSISEGSRAKSGNTRSKSEASRSKAKVVANGRRKTTETAEVSAKKNKIVTKVVEKFDENSRNHCVSAFQESESWD